MRSVVCFTCSSGPATIGSPTTAVCGIPHCQCGLRPFVRIRCVPHNPTGVIATLGPPGEARRARLGEHRLEILRDRALRGTRRRTRREPSASTAAVSASRRVGATPPNRNLVRGPQQRAEHRLVEQLGLGEVAHVAAADGRRPTRASTDRDTRRDCSRARPGPIVGMWCAPSIVQCRPHRSQGQKTPFATEYTGSTLGSIRTPCRPGALPTPRASLSRCGRLHWARCGSRTHSTTTHAASSRARWPSASSPPPARDRS